MLRAGTTYTARLFGIAALALHSLSVSAEDVDAKALVERMSAYIAGLPGFIVEGDAYTDARLDAGQIIEHSEQVTLRLRRQPAAVRITNRTTEDTEEIFFDDGALSVYQQSANFFAQTEIPKGLDSMLDYAVNTVEIESPMLDLVAADMADHLLQDAQDISYLGTSLIRDATFHHVGIRLPEIDIQVWIATEGNPLPGKLAITSKWEGGSPRFVAFFNWTVDPTFPVDQFDFSPPAGAVEVDFLHEP